jgi:hypothetical protein
LTAFDSLFQGLGPLLGIAAGPGGRPRWIGETQKAFRALDEQWERLFDLAVRDGSAIALLSPYGFLPGREKIVVNELLRRSDLLCVAEGPSRIRYECARFFARQKQRFRLADRSAQSLGGLLPIDWRRTRAVCLHGENAAFVYLNTPERFGGRVLTTTGQKEQALAEVIAALAEARHPLTAERLFHEAFSTAARFGINPLKKRWPEVIGIPARGYQVRQRLDHARQLVRPDPSVSAARTGEGFLCWQAPGAAGREFEALDLSEVMQIIL